MIDVYNYLFIYIATAVVLLGNVTITSVCVMEMSTEVTHSYRLYLENVQEEKYPTYDAIEKKTKSRKMFVIFVQFLGQKSTFGSLF